MKALEIKNFVKKYGDFEAVKGIDLEVKEGEFFGFLGPNGAGKSSTIHAMVGISTITDGQIKIFGVDADKNYKEARALIGHSPQEFNIDIFMPVEKILWYMGGYYGMPREKRKERLEEMLNVFELLDLRKKQFRHLSGGQKRRTMLARAMMHDPKLLILDEPTAGIDVELRNELHEYLKKINKQGKTIFLTSHYLEEVEKLCERVAIIDGGKIVAVGTRDEFTKDGKNLEKAYLEITAKQKKK